MTTTDNSTTIDIDTLLAERRKIAIIWSIEDVQEVRPDLSDEQAWEALQAVKNNHDATVGINWLTLEMVAEDLFGYATATDDVHDQQGQS